MFNSLLGAENISVKLGKESGKKFIPTRFAQDSSPEAAWRYWSKRRHAEDALKQAIMNQKVRSIRCGCVICETSLTDVCFMCSGP